MNSIIYPTRVDIVLLKPKSNSQTRQMAMTLTYQLHELGVTDPGFTQECLQDASYDLFAKVKDYLTEAQKRLELVGITGFSGQVTAIRFGQAIAWVTVISEIDCVDFELELETVIKKAHPFWAITPFISCASSRRSSDFGISCVGCIQISVNENSEG